MTPFLRVNPVNHRFMSLKSCVVLMKTVILYNYFFPIVSSAVSHLLHLLYTFSPGWTPLPLFPKGSSLQGGVACGRQSPVSVVWGGGVKRRRKSLWAGEGREFQCTAGRGSYSATHCFVIVPMAFCPQWSAGRAASRDWSETFWASHTRFDPLMFRRGCWGGSVKEGRHSQLEHICQREGSEEAWMSHQSRRQKSPKKRTPNFKPHDMGE